MLFFFPGIAMLLAFAVVTAVIIVAIIFMIATFLSTTIDLSRLLAWLVLFYVFLIPI